MKYYTMPETRAFLESIGMPGGDLYDLPTSDKRFPDGGQYRFEVPGIQGPGPMKALLEALDEYGIQIHRVTQTKGIMFLTDDEISKILAEREADGQQAVQTTRLRGRGDDEMGEDQGAGTGVRDA